MSEPSLVITDPPKLPPIRLSDEGKAAKEQALAASALIGKVTGVDSKIIAVRAQQELKRFIADVEKARVAYKEPALVYGRQVDTFAAAEKLEAEREYGRVSQAVKEFDDAERRRVQEEERLQREELERIEREKQAELKRIADEQAAREAEARRLQEEIDRKAREAQITADRLTMEARTKKQRADAEKARLESERVAKEAEAARQLQESAIRAQREADAAKTSEINDRAGEASYVAARPIEITKVFGQNTRREWKITKINDWVLAKARPDLVRKIEFDMIAVKQELARTHGVLPGVEATEEYSAGVKLPPERKAIEV